MNVARLTVNRSILICLWTMFKISFGYSFNPESNVVRTFLEKTYYTDSASNSFLSPKQTKTNKKKKKKEQATSFPPSRGNNIPTE